nr:stromal interaction molecule homolog isoform X2 [Parasteatoda tepidariorum]
MQMLFIFFVPWIFMSNIRCKTIVKYSYVASCVVFILSCATADEKGGVSDEEFLIKSHKVIEAVPKVLGRSTSASGLPDDWNCATVNACDDPIGYEAIRGLHRQLDDDANGSIDVSETDEFLRDELQYENGRHKERHKEFHGTDKYINVDELWQVWKMSEVHNWTVDETVDWLITQVDLPQYEHNFRNNGVNGASLPLLAQNVNNYISMNLGIKDSIHKQKIALKAMDVVLFGRPKYRNYFKDVAVAVSCIVSAGVCWFAYVQNKYSKAHLQKMMKDMESLQKAEDSLLDLQKELSKARHEQEIVSIEKQDLERRLQDQRSLEHSISDCSDPDGLSRISELEKQLQIARCDLREAEKKLEARHWVAPVTLQHWLQLTHEIEQRNYNAKKSVAEQQLLAAKEGCEKLSKKRATFMGAFRIAHGSSIDDVDDRIVKAKSALYEVTTDLQERMHRWKQVEILCGFPIIHNPGLASLESILKPTLLNGTSSSTHSGLNTLTHSSSETTLREESPPPYTGIVPTCISSSTKTTDRHSFKAQRFLVHRDSGISLTSAAQTPAASTSKSGSGVANIPPPPSYSKSSPSLIKNNPDIMAYSALASTSRVVYPRECYRPLESVSSFETDNEEILIPDPVDDDSTERSNTPPSLASCPESSRPMFTLTDGNQGKPHNYEKQKTNSSWNRKLPHIFKFWNSSPKRPGGGISLVKNKEVYLSSPLQLTSEPSNGRMGDIVRKISASILDKKKKPGSLAVEALKKSASSSNIVENSEGGASSESSSSTISEEKYKKKKFFQTLRHRKQKT